MIGQVADVVVVSDCKVLLVQQRKKSAYGLWSYPGGGVEDGETLEDTVVREVSEELGSKLVNYKFYKKYVITTQRGELTINTFTGELDGDIRLKEDELITYGWFELQQIEEMKDKLRSDIVYEQAKDVLDNKVTTQ